MPLWGKIDQANNAPKHIIEAGRTTDGNTGYGNVTVSGARAVGMFGVDSTEAGLASGISHAGWVTVRQGTGPVTSVTVSAGGTLYNNSDLIVVSGGSSNGAGTLVTNSTGGITSVTITSSGAGFLNVANTTVAVTNSTGGASAGSNATFVPLLGGRAGRVHMETIVAMGSMTGDGTDDATFADS